MNEPSAMITDYLLGIISLYLAVYLFKLTYTEKQYSIASLTIAFSTSAIAAFAGGTYHSFFTSMNHTIHTVFWTITVYALSFTSLFMFIAVILSSVFPLMRTSLLIIAWLKFMLFVCWMAIHDDFKYVIIDYGLTLIGILILQIYVIKYWKENYSKWIISGVIVAFFGGMFQLIGFDISKIFNHNDIFHIFQIISLYLLYKGGIQFKDRFPF